MTTPSEREALAAFDKVFGEELHCAAMNGADGSYGAALKRGWDAAIASAPAQAEPSYAQLVEMAYLLRLVPRGEAVAVQLLEVLQEQFKAAMAVAAQSPPPAAPARTIKDRSDELSIDQDGDIALDWSTQGSLLSISVRKDGQAAFAWLLASGEKGSGTVQLGHGAFDVLSPLAAAPAPQVLPPFETEWQKKVALGYQYGSDALEQVRFGYEIARAALQGGAK